MLGETGVQVSFDMLMGVSAATGLRPNNFAVYLQAFFLELFEFIENWIKSTELFPIPAASTPRQI